MNRPRSAAQFSHTLFVLKAIGVDAYPDQWQAGRPAAEARDEALEKDITINVLVILTPEGESFRPEHTNPRGGLEKYFQDNIIGGPGAFTVVAEGHEAFERALVKKLIQEIANGTAARTSAPA